MKDLIQSVYSSKEVLEFTYKCAIACMRLEGVFIECGVAAGSQLAMMKQALIDNGIDKKVYGFDSFQGIPHATDNDTSQPGIGEIDKTKYGVLETTGVSSHNRYNVIENFRKWEVDMNNVELVEGWFEDTIEVKSKDIEKIALLRLDGDLYRSTRVCLEHLLNKVVEGGFVIIDDYQLEGCRKAVHQFINEDDINLIHGIAYYVK